MLCHSEKGGPSENPTARLPHKLMQASPLKPQPLPQPDTTEAAKHTRPSTRTRSPKTLRPPSPKAEPEPSTSTTPKPEVPNVLINPTLQQGLSGLGFQKPQEPEDLVTNIMDLAESDKRKKSAEPLAVMREKASVLEK